MPRRPRPAHRPPPQSVREADGDDRRAAVKPNAKQGVARASSSSSNSKYQKRPIEDVESSSGESEGEELEDSEENEFEQGSSQDGWSELDGSEDEEGGEEAEEEEDADAPRVVAWDGDDNLRYDSPSDDGEEDEDESEVEDRPKQKERMMKGKKDAADRLQSRLQDIPLGALRKAQNMLGRAEPDSDSGSDSEEDSDEAPDALDSKGKGKEREKVEWNAKPRKDIAKRKDKNAPMEVTSKKPVPRRRQVVEVPKINARDPRFLPTAGELSTSKFQQNYSFLSDKHQGELAELKATLKTARKRLPSTPRDTREEAENEVRRLELAVKRAESAVNKDRLDKVQRETLAHVKKDETAKREKGKKEWYLKKGEKREMMVKARYEALAKEGGQRAVKKAIEKKQKKIGQREKRSRPDHKRRRVQ